MRFAKVVRCIAMLAGISAASAQAAPWRSLLVESPGRIQLHPDDYSDVRMQVAGDGALRIYPIRSSLAGDLDGGQGFQSVARLGATGTVANLTAGAAPEYSNGKLLDDGSLITLSWTVSRIAADGSVMWSIPNPFNGGGLIGDAGGNNLLLVGDSGRVQVRQLDRDSGRLLDMVDVQQSATSCAALSVVGDGAGSWFVAVRCDGVRVIKLTGSPLRVDSSWQLPSAGSPALATQGLLRYDAGALYSEVFENSVSRLAKFSATTGALLWTYPDASSALTSASWVLTDSDILLARAWQADGLPVLQRLNAASGQMLWSSVDAFDAYMATLTSDQLVVGGHRELSGGRSQGYVQRLDLATGSSVWQSSLVPASGDSQVRALAIQGSQAVALGRVCGLPPNNHFDCQLDLWRLNATSGALLETGSLKARIGYRGVYVTSALAGSQVQAALQMGGDGQQLRIQRLRESDGQVLFETVVPAAMTIPWMVPDYVQVQATADGHYLAQLSSYFYGTPAYESDVVLLKIHGSSGALLWRRSMIDFSTGPQNIYTNSPATDRDGNVVISVSYEDDWRTRRTTLMKLASASGQTLWELPQPVLHGAMNPAASVMAIGNDVLVSSGASGWERRRGSDGAVMWSAAVLPVYSGHIDEDSIVGVYPAGNQLSFLHIDAATGATVASGTYSNSEDSAFQSVTTVRGADGDVYASAMRRNGGVFKPIVVKFSATTGALLWANRLDAESLPGSQWTVRLLANDRLYLSGRPSSAFSSYLMTLATADGSHRGTQLLYANDENQYDLARELGVPVGLLADGHLITKGSQQDPGQPLRSFIESRPSPLNGVIGALRIAAATQDAALAGSAGKSFVIDVINEGTTAAVAVRTVVGFGSDATLENVSCSLAGSPCSATLSSGLVRITTTLPAGATLRLSGRASVPAGSEAAIQLSASAIAAYGFAEMNLTDNFAADSLPFRDRIFSDSLD